MDDMNSFKERVNNIIKRLKEKQMGCEDTLKTVFKCKGCKEQVDIIYMGRIKDYCEVCCEHNDEEPGSTLK